MANRLAVSRNYKHPCFLCIIFCLRTLSSPFLPHSSQYLPPPLLPSKRQAVVADLLFLVDLCFDGFCLYVLNVFFSVADFIRRQCRALPRATDGLGGRPRARCSAQQPSSPEPEIEDAAALKKLRENYMQRRTNPSQSEVEVRARAR